MGKRYEFDKNISRSMDNKFFPYFVNYILFTNKKYITIYKHLK